MNESEHIERGDRPGGSQRVRKPYEAPAVEPLGSFEDLTLLLQDGDSDVLVGGNPAGGTLPGMTMLS